jgi:hypothetical protein
LTPLRCFAGHQGELESLQTHICMKPMNPSLVELRHLGFRGFADAQCESRPVLTVQIR